MNAALIGALSATLMTTAYLGYQDYRAKSALVAQLEKLESRLPDATNEERSEIIHQSDKIIKRMKKLL
jgi:hypothetical protein